jgi:hypothetical protein
MKSNNPRTARTRRLRERQRRGEIVVPVPVNNDVIAALIALRWANPDRSEDRQEIGRAIARLLADAATRVPKELSTR